MNARSSATALHAVTALVRSRPKRFSAAPDGVGVAAGAGFAGAGAVAGAGLGGDC
jgi:hypothetical protein